MSETDVAVTARMLDDMIELQDRHNRAVAEDWRERGFDYYRAVWVECAELLDHFGWKWWKKQTPDDDQVRLELVDIWHFGLSMLIRDRAPVADLAARFHDEVGAARDPEAFRTDVEAMAAAALTTRSFSVDTFIDCLNAIDLDFAGLYRAYIGKNVLNNFRQHHGYRDGSYRKLWAGREDNEHLMELVAGLDVTAGDFPERLYDALAERYAATA
jgi:dimeric dUTPase (all-alpha-NTP-PPase superfamily)